MAKKRAEPWLLVLGLGALGGPSACLSDVTIPQCVLDGDCGVSGGVGDSGGADGIGESGSAGADSASGGPGTLVVDTGGNGAGGSAHAGSGSRGGVGVGGTSMAGGGGSFGGAPIAGTGGSAGTGAAGGEPWCCFDLPIELPGPCTGQPYSTSLTVYGGTSPYHWTVSASTGTWNIAPDLSSPDGSAVTLEGEPAAGAVELTVVVTDAKEHQQSATYPLVPRSSCYFAYVAPTGGQSQLQLLDPLLKVPAPVTLVNNTSVFDFKFSPDGRFLAYRFGQGTAHPQGAHLSLVDLVSFQDQTLLLGEDEVTAFDWSADSRTLAVAFDTDQDSYLGGVHIQVAGSAAATLQTLTPTPIVATASLSWFAGKYVAFSGESDQPPLIAPYFSELLSGGFDVPFESDIFFHTVRRLKGNDVGFFATGTTDSGDSVFYWPNDSDFYSAEHQADFIAPSGHFSAQLVGTSLRIRGAEQDFNQAPLIQSPAATGCPKLLTWAEQRERIACAADVAATATVPAHGEIRIFDLGSPASGPLAVSTVEGYCTEPSDQVPTAQTCAPLEYDYTQGSSTLQTRLFSPSGRWLAFTKSTPPPGGTRLYLADLSQTPMTVVRSDLVAAFVAVTAPVVLAFSPDEQFLLKQQGTLLTLHLLSAPQNSGQNSAPRLISNQIVLDPNAGSACLDDYATDPQRWCGATDRVRPFRWSANSKWYAYRSIDKGENHLTIASVAQFPNNPSTYPFVAADCAGACSGDFAFQP